MDPDVMLDLFQNKLNHTELQQAALFDLFTSQCDRHQQNYFVNEHGKLWAIDNDQVRARVNTYLCVCACIVCACVFCVMLRSCIRMHAVHCLVS